MIAGLPMYERPETAAAHDRYWRAIRDALRSRGSKAPDSLTRGIDPWVLWQRDDLVLAQTCGLPYRARLAARVGLVGAPDYGLPGLPPGYYQSVMIVRADDPRDDLQGFDGAALAYNEPLSQSGWAAAATAGTKAGIRFGPRIRTGAHRQSVCHVAAARADIAFVDAVTWRDICRYEPDLVAPLRALGHTAPTPGLPYIAAATADTGQIAGAVETAIAGLDAVDRDALGIVGLVRFAPADYQALAIPAPP